MSARQSATVVITGASSGIGRDVARGLIERGWNVVLNARRAQALEQAAQALSRDDRISLVVGDIAHADTGARLVEAAIERFGRLDALVNNAGLFGLKPFLDNTREDIDRYVDTNLKGTYQVTQAVVRQLCRQSTGGAIVNIGTVLVPHPSASLPASAALISKGGIHALTTSLASELACHRIRVNAVAPGVIRTPIYGDADLDELGQSALLGRAGDVAQVTEAVIHLATASFTTGVILPVDGGYVHGRA